MAGLSQMASERAKYRARTQEILESIGVDFDGFVEASLPQSFRTNEGLFLFQEMAEREAKLAEGIAILMEHINELHDKIDRVCHEAKLFDHAEDCGDEYCASNRCHPSEIGKERN